MDLVVIGGGPGGLYLSLLLKRDRPRSRVRVFERNRPGDTFGFGVAFHAATLQKLAEADPPSQQGLLQLLRPWDDVAFHVRGVERRVSGHRFAGCSRHALLDLLQRRAASLGVELEFGRPVASADFPDADVVVAADGAGSRTRGQWPETGSTVDERPNRFVWLGTTLPLDAMNFFFVEQPEGVFVAHAYPHSSGQGTWIVETDDETFSRCGIEASDEEGTVALVERVFERELRGHHVVAAGGWRRFPLITSARWVHRNVALLGDAKGTVHYSIGSGTKIAMEDAVSLHAAFMAASEPVAALSAYERERRAELQRLQAMAYGSMLWFERLRDHWHLPEPQFVLSGITRKTDETYETVLAKAPQLVAAAVGALSPAVTGGRVAAGELHPVEVPFAASGLALAGRLVLGEGVAADDAWARPALFLTEPAALGGPWGSTGAAAVAGPGSEMVPVGLVLVPPPPLGDGPRRVPPAGWLEERIAAAGRRAAANGALLLELDLSAWQLDWSDGDGDGDLWELACGLTATIAAVWGDERPLGVRLAVPATPHAAVGRIAPLVASGCTLVDVSGGSTSGGLVDRQVLVSDLVRQQLGVATLCGGLSSREEADTVLAAGRADLVVIR